MNSKGKISCICVTHRKLTLLKNSVVCYTQQSYANKELVIVFNTGDEETDGFVSSNPQYRWLRYTEHQNDASSLWVVDVVNDVSSDITFIEVKSSHALENGLKRDLGIEYSSGEYICLWNPEEYHAPERLASQLAFLQFMKKAAVTLANSLCYHRFSGRTHLFRTNLLGRPETLLATRQKMMESMSVSPAERTEQLVQLFKNSKSVTVMDDKRLCIAYVHGEAYYDVFDPIQKVSEEDVAYVKNSLLVSTNGNFEVYDAVLSLGCWCQVGVVSSVYGLKKIDSPLDNYGIKTWQHVIDILETRFSDLWNLENIAIGKVENNWSLKYIKNQKMYKVYDNKYNLVTPHHFDESDNSETTLHTYPEFKREIEKLAAVFLRQCEVYNRVLFVCKVMNLPVEETTLSKDDLIRLCTVLSKLRQGKSYALKLLVPAHYYQEALSWVKEEQWTHVHIYSWNVVWNVDELHEEWVPVYDAVRLSSDYQNRLDEFLLQENKALV